MSKKGMREWWDARGDQILAMRETGKTWAEIGEAMNIGKQGAIKAAKRAAERNTTELAE